MTEPSDVNQIEDKPAARNAPEPGKELDKTDETKEEANAPQIPVKQVPMDGICGGY
ncbi:MAG: hypothetical protein Q7V04_09140 [Deltaproteobacteria bacterium]|nr:hypothetical protein [Deltaproteobacteria bacterium]